MSRAESKAQTLEKLRVAGREALLDLGVQEASIQDITSRAGLAVGTFYVHFESKAELVDSLVRELNEGLARQMMAVLLAPPLPPARALVGSLAEVVVEYWAAHAREMPLLTDHVARNADEEILRVGANPEVVALVRGLVRTMPALTLRTSPDLLVAMLVAVFRAAGRVGVGLPREARADVARDLAVAARGLLDAFVPGLLDADPGAVIAAAFAAMQQGGGGAGGARV